MWIKTASQNRLLNLDQVTDISLESPGRIIAGLPYAFGESEASIEVGKYATDERALEVLGEIEFDVSCECRRLYVMPKE